jgi:hypothetical protein
MADNGIPKITDGATQATMLDAMERWQDGNGQWWTVGDVTPDGCIVGQPERLYGRFHTSGTIWIRKDVLSEAVKHGWKPSGIEVDDLVQVAR